MDDQRKHPRRGGLFLGLLLVIAGTAILLGHLGLLGDYDAWDFWPLILVLWGLVRLVGARSGAGRLWAVLVLGAGTLAQLHTLEVIRLEWRLIWPIGVIALGLVILVSSLMRRRRRPDARAIGSPDMLDIKVMFGGKEERIDSDEFVGGEIQCTMGACELDLREATMKGDSATINVRCVMGGLEIAVPRDWHVSVRGNPVMGAFEDKTRPSRRDGPLLVIEGSALMSGVEIRN